MLYFCRLNRFIRLILRDTFLAKENQVKKDIWKLSLTYAAAILILSGCASVHNGNYAQVENSSKTKSKNESQRTSSGLIISGQEIKDLSSKFIAQLDFTFENKSNKWIRINQIKLDFGSNEANDKISFPVGTDLNAWASSAQQTQAIKNYNFNMAMKTVAALGVTSAISSGNNQNQHIAGLLTSLGASSALTAKAAQAQLNQVQLANLVPESHLLSGNLVIPPGLHTKKWIAVYTATPYDMPYIDTVIFEITSSDGSIEKLKLPFRVSGMSKSEWQKDYPVDTSNRWNMYLHKRKRENLLNKITMSDSEIRVEYI